MVAMSVVVGDAITHPAKTMPTPFTSIRVIFCTSGVSTVRTMNSITYNRTYTLPHAPAPKQRCFRTSHSSSSSTSRKRVYPPIERRHLIHYPHAIGRGGSLHAQLADRPDIHRR